MLNDISIYRKINRVTGLLENPKIKGEERNNLYLELYFLKQRANLEHSAYSEAY